MITTIRATLDDLARVKGKAELINGEVVELPVSGILPNLLAKLLTWSLVLHVRAELERTGVRLGYAFPDGLRYAVPELPSGRESFQPDVSLFAGPLPADRMMDGVEGPPPFAIEIRSTFDYGWAAERDLAAKRADYFQAGTLVVWDVDPIAECIYAYRRTSPEDARIFRRGQQADAEPAIPGWLVDVAELFEAVTTQ